MITKFDAIKSLVPEAEVIVRGSEITAEVEWLVEPNNKPTDSEIVTEMARLEAIFEANKYKQQRALEYPSIGDQLDALFHAGVFPSDMAAQIQAIKDKYPKV